MESVQQYDSTLFSEFFDWQPQSFVWLKPIWNEQENEIVDFEYVYSNEPGLTYLKLSREMLGKIRISNTPSLNDSLRSVVFKEMLSVFQTGNTVTIDMYNPVIDKYATVYRMKFRGGVLTTIQDKTAEKRAIIELSKKTKELQTLNESLKEFAYAASHDLQEPLRKVLSFSDRLKEQLTLNDVQQSLFGRLESSAARMKTLIDDLLAYSLVTTKRETFVDIRLNQVVDDVCSLIETSINDSGTTVQVGSLPTVYADRSQMLQLFQNLLSNAIKYRDRERSLKVTISASVVPATDEALSPFSGVDAKSYHLIEISDNGIGFEQQYAERIFQVFQRLHGRSEYPGTGIGLAIAQKVMKNHSGFIKAIGKPGEGASFQLFFPST